jgi:hypothetical protein
MLINFVASICMKNLSLSDNLIEVYRQLVNERYQYEALKSITELEDFITKKRVEEVRAYFLNYIYPDAAARKTINDAFNNLDNHFKKPAHLLNLIGNGASMAFKFGFQFPQALKAGLTSLESFKSAQGFEKALLDAALQQKLAAPLSINDFEKLVSTLPKKQLQNFIQSFDDLLSSLTNTALTKKTVAIINELIEKMKLHPEIYTKEDLNGIKMGVNILDAGYHLFSDMNDREKKALTNLIIKVENIHLDRIFRKYKY